MRLERNATLKCGALRRRKMAVATGARGAVLCDAQPILEAGTLTQARTGDQARREESAAETRSRFGGGGVRYDFRNIPHVLNCLLIGSLSL